MNESHYEDPSHRWSVSVPVHEAELRTETATGTWAGDPFAAARLAIYAGWDNKGHYTLRGPNIRKDGTHGGRTLSRGTHRLYVETSYPLTLAAAKAALGQLAQNIRSAADRACTQIEELRS